MYTGCKQASMSTRTVNNELCDSNNDNDKT